MTYWGCFRSQKIDNVGLERLEFLTAAYCCLLAPHSCWPAVAGTLPWCVIHLDVLSIYTLHRLLITLSPPVIGAFCNALPNGQSTLRQWQLA